MLLTALNFSHQLLQEILVPGDQVIDATMGQGNDTEFLASIVKTTGHVYAFDIQQTAIDKTAARLKEKQLIQQVSLLHTGHETIARHVHFPIKAAIFNLGYLPQSDKAIITLPKTTKIAIDACKELLLPKGRIVIVSYYGHTGGKQELDTVTEYCQNLPQAQYNVMSYRFINQKNNPPILFCIEKK